MTSQLIHELRQMDDVAFHQGADTQLFKRFQSENGLVLPPAHMELLRLSNGIGGYAGYIRIFGLYTTEGLDAVLWNHRDYWKFAWGERCTAYWCFAETAWGDQYAYAVKSLKAGGDATVYFLDALSMSPEVVAGSFVEFLEKEFVRSAKSPYDAMTTQARNKFGSLDMTSHLVHVPSLLLGGIERIATVQKMNARSAMICNGDIAMQLDEGQSGGTVKAVQTYLDEMRRTRLRLVWE